MKRKCLSGMRYLLLTALFFQTLCVELKASISKKELRSTIMVVNPNWKDFRSYGGLFKFNGREYKILKVDNLYMAAGVKKIPSQKEQKLILQSFFLKEALPSIRTEEISSIGNAAGKIERISRKIKNLCDDFLNTTSRLNEGRSFFGISQRQIVNEAMKLFLGVSLDDVETSVRILKVSSSEVNKKSKKIWENYRRFEQLRAYISYNTQVDVVKINNSVPILENLSQSLKELVQAGRTVISRAETPISYLRRLSNASGKLSFLAPSAGQIVRSYDNFLVKLNEIENSATNLDQIENEVLSKSERSANELHGEISSIFKKRYIVLRNEISSALSALDVGSKVEDENINKKARGLSSEYERYQKKLKESEDQLSKDYYSAFWSLKVAAKDLENRRKELWVLLSQTSSHLAMSLNKHPLHFLKGGTVKAYLSKVERVKSQTQLDSNGIKNISAVVVEGYSIKHNLLVTTKVLFILLVLVILLIVGFILYQKKSVKQI